MLQLPVQDIELSEASQHCLSLSLQSCWVLCQHLPEFGWFRGEVSQGNGPGETFLQISNSAALIKIKQNKLTQKNQITVHGKCWQCQMVPVIRSAGATTESKNVKNVLLTCLFLITDTKAFVVHILFFVPVKQN